ncbi:hypothetical protein EJD97_008679 [Solanum chilense]|uniref:Uncharacterized protein n=1 Tax=Solanum chilense TaxID=4083 RepID=A0A6N2BTZ6_SOLCI|nr:hypothetical protein EJD97_008679 [Solanum chilense]
MLTRITRTGIHVNGVKNPLLFSIDNFRFVLHCSTSAAPTHYLVDLLVDSLGFSKEEAVTTSSKVIRLKPSKNPQFVVDFFQKNDFDNTQIKNIVSKSPKVLFSNVDKTLKPKLEILQEIGLSGTDLYKFIIENDLFFSKGLDTFIRPSLDYLRNLLGSDENVVKIIKKSSWLLRCHVTKTIAPNVLLLHDVGLSDEKIRKFILQNPKRITRNLGCLKDVIHRVEKDLGIPRESRTFFNGIAAIVSFRQSTLAKKIDVYKSFGWSDEHIRTMTRNYPSCLSSSEVRICKQLTFLMNEVGCTSEYLASHSRLFTHSLEKRVIPRYRVLKILNEKHLKKGVGLFTAVSMTPSKFMEVILLPYKDRIPIAYEAYMKSVG